MRPVTLLAPAAPADPANADHDRQRINLTRPADFPAGCASSDGQNNHGCAAVRQATNMLNQPGARRVDRHSRFRNAGRAGRR